MKTLNIEEFASSKESKFQAAYSNVMPECDAVTSTFLVDRAFSCRLIDRLVASFRSHLRVIVTCAADH